MSSVADLYLEWLTMQIIKYGVDAPIDPADIEPHEGWNFTGNASAYMHIKYRNRKLIFTDNAIKFLEMRHGRS